MSQARKSVLFVSAVALVLSACGSDSNGGGAGSPAVGNGSSATGGSAVQGDGGSPAAGATSSGGDPATAMGGAAASAGSSSTGGRSSPSRGGAASGGSAGALSAAGGSGPGVDCNVAPANPNATKQARNLLCYIYSQYGNHVLSGQQETSWSNPANDISWYGTNGMKTPAILGGDFLYPNGTATRAIAYWNAGGISMIRYHMGAPPLADSYNNSKASSNLDNVLQAGTAENTSFKAKLDYAAAELKKLQDANVPVIWAPFHEVQQGGWFWWAKGTGAQFVALWKYEFDYFTTTKGLNNLVWLAPFSGMPSSPYYPGPGYVDLSGPDTYGTNQPFTGLYTTAKGVIGPNVPIALHETGLIPSPANMFPSAAPWVLFNVWAGYESDGTHNSTANIKTVYADSHVVTRDEIPNLK
jgi:Glycosyl hydrolase family 26